jgi:hypothetical protein
MRSAIGRDSQNPRSAPAGRRIKTILTTRSMGQLSSKDGALACHVATPDMHAFERDLSAKPLIRPSNGGFNLKLLEAALKHS